MISQTIQISDQMVQYLDAIQIQEDPQWKFRTYSYYFGPIFGQPSKFGRTNPVTVEKPD